RGETTSRTLSEDRTPLHLVVLAVSRPHLGRHLAPINEGTKGVQHGPVSGVQLRFPRLDGRGHRRSGERTAAELGVERRKLRIPALELRRVKGDVEIVKAG